MNNKIPTIHQDFLDNSVMKLMEDERILGVAAGGSMLLGTMDQFSDIDLVIVVDPKQYSRVLDERKNIANKIGSLLGSFTGEHVGEPRLLICLYGPPLLHVDFKFISLDDIEERVEDFIIIWERNKALSNITYKKVAKFPAPDMDWIEDRFWIWIHYAATKIGRGELFETLDFISFLRNTVIGPLILQDNKARPQGVRKIEKYATPHQLELLNSTIAEHNTKSCLNAIRKVIDVYHELRPANTTTEIEKQTIKYLNEIENQ